ncbi:MAG TPA: ElyC/SanA/YdcF family protein [Opitutaceae bacterium]|nr:ElyC/SanA/YdcF family protein [Opitutaceae bacterium]
MFWAKKFVSFWLLPVPVCLALLTIGVILVCFTRRVRTGRALLVAGTVLLLLFSNKVVSTWLVRPLETRYAAMPELSANATPPESLAACQYLVVLGGGHTDAVGLTPLTQLSPSGRARLVEAVRLLRVLPAARLIVSGPGSGTNVSHASVLARAAESLGVERGRILLVETARDTEDEAGAVWKIAGSAPVGLVTSAWHMPRAAALFRKAGVSTLPCPADFSVRQNHDFRWSDLTWDSASLERSTWAVRERIGYLWVWLRRKV